MINECKRCLGCCMCLYEPNPWEEFDIPWVEIKDMHNQEPFCICPFSLILESFQGFCLINDDKPTICKEYACDYMKEGKFQSNFPPT